MFSLLSVLADYIYALEIPVQIDRVQADPQCILYPTISFFFFRSFLPLE